MVSTFWKYCTFKQGLETVFRGYHIIAMRYLWEIGEEGAGSGKVWLHVNEVLQEKGETKSRSSIIFFLNDMVDMDILDFREKTGKGGYHRIYYPKFDEAGFKEHLAKTIISKLMTEFQDETDEALRKILSTM